MSTSVQNWVVGVTTLEPQAFLDRNMDDVTTDMSKKPAKRCPKIKLIRFVFNAKGNELYIRISPGVTSSFKFCLRLPQHSWELVSDEIKLLSSPAKVLHFSGSLSKSINSAAPHTPERQTIKFEKDNDSYDSNNVFN